MEGYREIPPEEYAAFTREWVGHAYQALAPTGSIYLFSGWNRLRDVLTALDEAGFVTLNHLIWKYQFGVFTRRKFVTSHYPILYAVKNPKEYTFHKIDHYPEEVGDQQGDPERKEKNTHQVLGTGQENPGIFQ